MDAKIWELVLALVGGGVVSGVLVWAYNCIRQTGIKSSEAKELLKRVDVIEARQCSQEEAHDELEKKMAKDFTSLERKMSDSNRDLDIRLTKMEVDILHIKELQTLHNQALNETSKDIKQLLSR